MSGMDADAWTSIGGRGCSGLLGANKLYEITYITLFTAAPLHTFKKQSQKIAKFSGLPHSFLRVPSPTGFS